MKKIIALILGAAMLLTLTACGGTSGGDHDRLLEMLDQHDYTGAVNYINNLAYDYAQQNKDPNADEYVYTAALFGEWVAYNAKEGVTVPKVEFKDDGTCTIGENNYLWEVFGESETSLSVNILNGAEQVHSFSLSKDKNVGTIIGSSGNIVKETWINFYNPAHFEVVEITVDNFADYFDIKEYFSYNKNEFDEVKDIYANKQWELKDTYYSRLWTSLTDVAVEYTSNSGDKYAQWDLAAKTCTLLDKYELNMDNGAPRVYTYTEKLNNYSDSSTENSEDYYYGYRFNCIGGRVMDSTGEQYFSSYYTNVKLTRVQGKLYLVKDEIKNLIKPEE